MSHSSGPGCGPGLLAGIGLYLDLALLPIVLKLFDAPLALAWSWWKATSGFWGPWGLLVVLAIGGWLLKLGQRCFSRG